MARQLAIDLSAPSAVDFGKIMTSSTGVVHRALMAIRTHLGLEVGYVSEFVGDQSVFRSVDAPDLEATIKVGDVYSSDDIYCRHILEGRLPEFIPDTSHEPLAAAMPITYSVPIGAHASVPIKLNSGMTFGMLCCLGFKARPGFSNSDRGLMRMMADIIGEQISDYAHAVRAGREKRALIDNVIDQDGLSVVYQPLWNIATRELVGFESLARFAGKPERSPDQWFAEAEMIGYRTRLEVAAIRRAALPFPLPVENLYLAVNVSPRTILHRSFSRLLSELPLDRMVLEITEHAVIDNYARLLAALKPFRDRGLKIAIDDTGAGFASLRHVLLLQPDIIKLDGSLIRDIDRDFSRQAAVSALVNFADETGSHLVAEAIETAEELQTVSQLGVTLAQGYYLGRPAPFEAASDEDAGPDRYAEAIAEVRQRGHDAFALYDRATLDLAVIDGGRT